jgi:hypothetical protein
MAHLHLADACLPGDGPPYLVDHVKGGPVGRFVDEQDLPFSKIVCPGYIHYLKKK